MANTNATELILWRMTLEPRDAVPYRVEDLVAKRRREIAQENIKKALRSCANVVRKEKAHG